MRVDIVALLYILQNIIEIGGHALGFQLIETALGTHFCRGCYEYFQFGIRKYSGSYIATIHDNSLVFTHLLLLRYHCCTHKTNGSYRTDMIAHFE